MGRYRRLRQVLRAWLYPQPGLRRRVVSLAGPLLEEWAAQSDPRPQGLELRRPRLARHHDRDTLRFCTERACPGSVFEGLRDRRRDWQPRQRYAPGLEPAARQRRPGYAARVFAAADVHGNVLADQPCPRVGTDVCGI